MQIKIYIAPNSLIKRDRGADIVFNTIAPCPSQASENLLYLVAIVGHCKYVVVGGVSWTEVPHPIRAVGSDGFC